MAEHRPFNVLFVCTGNSARSIIAEAILEREGQGRFKAYSAGSAPKGEVNARAIALLKRANHPTESFRPKDWEEFAKPDAPKLDFVFTLCDTAASEVCPVWTARTSCGPRWPIAARLSLPATWRTPFP